MRLLHSIIEWCLNFVIKLVKKFSAFYVRYRGHGIPPLGPLLSQLNSAHIFVPYLFKTDVNIFILPKPIFPKF